MVRRFIGGVATVMAIYNDDIIFNALTLLDSTFTIGVSAEDVRGGRGNQLLGKYYHTSTFDVKLTDVTFNLDYLALQTGSDITTGSDLFQIETKTVSSNTLTVSKAPTYAYGWISVPGTNDWTKVAFNTGTSVLPYIAADGTSMCVKYIAYDLNTEEIKISANMIPSEVRLVMIASTYKAGKAQTLTSSSKIGSVEIDVPRFQFSGSMEIGMTANGVANSSLEGSAMSNEDTDCTSETGYYATIKEKIDGYNVLSDVILMAIDGGDSISVTTGATKTLVVYGIRKVGTKMFTIPSDQLGYVSGTTAKATISTAGVITGVTAGTSLITVTLTANTAIVANAVVTVS